MSFKFSEVVDSVYAELRARNHAADYFKALRVGYIDDLNRITKIHGQGLLLEIGGFPFCFSICLKKLGIHTTSVDLCPHRANDLIKDYGLSVIACDIERQPLPFESRSVSTVVHCSTLEHLRVNPIFALEEMHRVLKPTGVLYLTTPNLYRLGNIVSFLLGRGLAFDPIQEYEKLERIGHMGHVREYTANEIRRLLARAGFGLVKIFRRAPPTERGALVTVLNRLMPPVRGELVIVARVLKHQEASVPKNNAATGN